MPRVMSFGRDSGVATRCRQRQNRMVRIVESVDYVMRRARMVWILLLNLKGNRARARLQAITLVFRTHQAKKRK